MKGLSVADNQCASTMESSARPPVCKVNVGEDATQRPSLPKSLSRVRHPLPNATLPGLREGTDLTVTPVVSLSSSKETHVR